MEKVFVCNAAVFAAAITVTGVNTTIAHASGLQAELRSPVAILPSSIPGAVASTAPAGAVVVGAQTWVCDAFQGFAPVVAIESGVVDPPLAIGTSGGIKLPISATTVPATCGQVALQSNQAVYVTQGVVDTRNTPSTARGVLRTALDPNTGALVGGSTYIASTAGLDGNQPTAAAIGPDGNLYVGFLKNGNVKRILNPLGSRLVPKAAAFAWFGVAMTSGGIAFAVWARFVLGQNWSSPITAREGHEFVRRGPYRGPYRLVRHPIYSGVLLASFGTAFAFPDVDRSRGSGGPQGSDDPRIMHGNRKGEAARP